MKGLKTGGRKAGTPNKQTQELQTIAEEFSVEPFKFLLMVMNNDLVGLGLKKEMGPGDEYEFVKDIPFPLRMRAAMELCTYLYPKRKAVEIRNEEPTEPPKFIINLTQEKGEE